MTAPRLEGRVLVTGAAGMLGSQLLLTAPAGVEAVGTDLVAASAGNPAVARAGLDLSSREAVAALFAELRPVGVIHGAAYTAVDKAEEEEPRAALANAAVPRVVAEACARARIPLVHVSTDFVFDGEKRTPYTVDDRPRPLSAYGRTKLAGEESVRAAHNAAAIVRTQWLYGPRGRHFPGTILGLAASKPELKVVHDQFGSPTSTLELAPALWDVLAARGGGLYHAACEGQASWFEFAAATLELCHKSTPVKPCTTAEFPRPARRPAYSVLDCARLTALRGRTLKPWREALRDFLAHERLLT
ncbi:MAG: dTDP-4-dehydrorhamnose reductase [Planctomycetes bacterium]|nr:dTDP-4-dehydrorhamnose reductase [Planctomycetota bacterium]